MNSRLLLTCALSLPILFLSGCDKHLGDELTAGPPWMLFTQGTTNGGLTNNRINNIFVDAGNRKWFATDYGASSYSRSGWLNFSTELQYTSYSSGGSSVSRKVNAITQGADGSIWFALAGGGVRRYFATGSSQPWTTYRTPDLSSDGVVAISVDRLGDVYCATTYGASRFKPSATDPIEGIWSVYLPDNSPIPTGFLEEVKPNVLTNTVWFGSGDGDLIQFDGSGGWQTWSAPENASPINRIAHESSSRLWVGTDDGAFTFSPAAGWTRYTAASTDSGLASDFVSCVLVDIDGNKWFGTERGVSVLTGSGWVKYTQENTKEIIPGFPGLPSNIITSLAIDIHRNIWIGTTKGVVAYNAEGVR